jgi:hypothetical protein
MKSHTMQTLSTWKLLQKNLPQHLPNALGLSRPSFI